MWLHVDAAYGAGARLSPRDAARVADLERADSVTVDPHKWLFQAYDIGGLMVRDGSTLGQAFGGRRPEYYRAGHAPEASTGDADATNGTGAAAHDDDDGHGSADQLNFWRLGFEGTRRWRALKLWLSWKHVGSSGFARLVEANDDLAAHLAERIAASDDFEALPAAPALSVVCFRHLPGGRPGAAPGTRRGDWRSMRTRTASRAPSRPRARAGSRPPACAAPRTCGQGSSTPSRRTDDVDDLLELLRRLARDA